jgi:hypothetical protein
MLPAPGSPLHPRPRDQIRLLRNAVKRHAEIDIQLRPKRLRNDGATAKSIS